MLGILISILGVDLSQTMNYYSNYIPERKAKKEIVVEVEEPAPIEVVEPPKEEYNINCYCITYARQFIPNLPKGNANSFTPNTHLQVGVLAIFDYNGVMHGAVVTCLDSNGFWVKEANKIKCKESVRFVKFDDKNLIGFFKPKLLTNKKTNMEEERKDEVAEEATEETSEVEEESTDEEDEE